MASLIIAWEYLTGRCVATDVSSRQRAEWPPHTARLFMALAAAWFETEQDADEGAALKWLENLGDPTLLLPSGEHVFPRSVVDVFVPVNDKAGPSKALLQSAPALTRDRQSRTFPSTWVGNAVCYARWEDVGEVDQHVAALNRLCSKVTRIGHPSSLVRMWVADELPQEPDGIEVWQPDETLAEFQVRRVSSGTLQLLTDLYGDTARVRHAELLQQVDALKEQKKSTKGKDAKKRKDEIAIEIARIERDLDAINPRPPIRPTIGLWSGYHRVDSTSAPGLALSHFDTDLLILTQQSGARLPLESTLQVTQALRKTVLKSCGLQPAPEWISGHLADGKPSNGEHGHLAMIPLPFVGSDHADGHLLGLALAFPRSVDRRDRGRCIGPLLLDNQGQPKTVELQLGRLGVWKLVKRDWSEQRQALRPETWTAHPKGATTWATVTPVVLDRFPKSDRIKNRQAWNQEIAETIRKACLRIGLPAPIEIDVDTTSWHRGVPRAIGKRRPLRGTIDENHQADASLGDGFSPYPAKGANASRPQLHIWLRFEQPVVGPVLIGAGRYLGYGVLKPIQGIRKAGE